LRIPFVACGDGGRLVGLREGGDILILGSAGEEEGDGAVLGITDWKADFVSGVELREEDGGEGWHGGEGPGKGVE